MTYSSRTNRPVRGPRAIAVAILAIAALAGALSYPFLPTSGPTLADEPLSACEKAAKHARRSCEDGARADFWRTVAQCDHLSTSQQRSDCRHEARAKLLTALALCEESHALRLDICTELPDGHSPLIHPEDFGPSISNPYMPLIPGTTMVYVREHAEGTDIIEIATLEQQRTILGVPCTTVHSTVRTDGVLVEDTLEWFAQDLDGNVWLFGELSRDFELSEVTSVEAWTAGTQSAAPGIVMMANPVVGHLYRHELAIGNSEDVSRALATGETVSVAYGTFEDCLVTLDESPLEPEDDEIKHYAPFAGLILEIDGETGDRMELVDIRTNG